jgi:hypothetical protein
MRTKLRINKSLQVLAIISALGLMTGTAVWGQATSGVIRGSVIDPQGAVVPNARVILINAGTGTRQEASTDVGGTFVFPSVPPASYTLTVEAQGFKKMEKKDLTLTAAERLEAGTLQLEVGATTDSVVVTADATPVQTASSERSAVVNDKQLESLLAPGRDYTSLLRILPGSVYEGTGNATLNTQSASNMNGVRNTYMSINVDGVIANTRNIGATEDPLNMDVVAEVKVLGSNYQAEYGKVAGAVIDVVTKSGTSQFHGNLYYYVRNEAFNANNFFNNLNGVINPRYRYNTIGYNAGGPIFGPGRLKSLRNKLFFFFSGEDQPTQSPAGLRTYTVPTPAERQGDFSQSVNSSGQLYLVKDPNTGVPYAGNVVPTSLINPTMQKILGVFPQPNYSNRAVSHGNYNYIISDSIDNPIHQEFLRLDWNPDDRWRVSFRGVDTHNNATSRTQPGLNAGWMNGSDSYNTRDPNVGLNVTFSASANVVNELALGVGLWFETNAASQDTLNQFIKTNQGINLPQLYPQNNPLNFLPAMSYGVIPSAAGLSYDARWPMEDAVVAPSLTDSLSIVRRKHTMKFGFYWDSAQYEQPHHAGSGSFSGSFAFSGQNTSNPFNTGYAYAEELLGYFDTYSESSARPNYWGVASTFEWYAQDTWRATPRLTLEYGVRFTADIPQSLKNNQGAMFEFNQYSPSQVPPLFQPVMVNGQRMMSNPLTGQVYPAVYYGRFVPGVGNPAPGSVAAVASNFPGFFKSQGLLPAPRLGVAYDVFGNGKTALRAGIGVFYSQRIFQGGMGNATFNPPTIFYPTQYYGNVSTFINAGGTLSPSNINTIFERNSHLPENFNLTFGIQHNIGHQTVLDVAYVGVLGRHLTQVQDLNRVPYGAEFLAQNQDPTTKTPLTDNYFRPYPGYGSMPYTSWSASSNYHSLQAQLTRRFAHGLQFGAAYTWSKSLDYSNGGGTVPTYLNEKLVYGPTSFDRKHRLVANWLWSLPKASRLWNNWAVRRALDDWQASGILTFSTGAPTGVSFSTTDGQNITGGGDGTSVTVIGNPVLTRGDQTFYRWFNTGAYARTPQGSIGSAWTYQFYGPGINDWDLAFFKRVPVEKIKSAFQLRCELYNAFNHTQFSSVNTSALFDPTGKQVNTSFGQISGARSARVMQLALRIQF